MDANTVLASRHYSFVFIAALILSILVAGLCFGKDISKRDAATIYLVVGQSEVIQTDIEINKIVLPASKKEEIVEVKLLSPGKIYVTGKKVGTTTIELRNVSREGTKDVIKDSRIYTVSVHATDKQELNRKQNFREDTAEISTQKLKEDIYRILNEKNINVYSAGDSIILSGIVSSATKRAQVAAVAEAVVSGDGKVVNLLEVSGIQQVMLEVRVSEISKNILKRMGVNFNLVSSSGRNFGLSLLNNLTNPLGFVPGASAGTINPGPSSGVDISPNVNAVFRFFNGKPTATALIDALKEDGLLKILAEPTLITMSGQEASFLAGGEFPVPVPQAIGGTTPTITIEWKQFGVSLNFTPTVLNDNKISMHVAPEVSELDFSTGIVLQGFSIPGISTRRISTVIELADGQSFAVAGLLQDRSRKSVDKFPLLGDIPILGTLFRSSSFQKEETDLVIIVTPHLVKPAETAKTKLPTDHFAEPNDFEFYLRGDIEGHMKGPGRHC